ncbi:transcriptional regulator, LytTR family [Shimia gijangensis]|uniref:Transcriptional regulator, LytTR family n=1 Tax=Shimia gijangensis TaxID=1470563 RepID=A0A1M6H023_9RHOB|nr:LytTR family DNA-binding domain-containing protein [Shimia gijangensis]SHJ15536.1 transcriptional regulator, LytTR family [Shimia gijangensis]
MNDKKEEPQLHDRPVWHVPEQAAAYVMATGIFTTLGPFGTFEMPFFLRAAYWALCLAAGWVFVSASLLLLRRPGFIHVNAPALNFAMAIALAAIPTALSVMAIEAFLRPKPGGIWQLKILLYVLLVCLIIGGAMIIYIRPRLNAPLRIPTYMTFLKRLPPQLGTELISLTSQDHYVEVTTEKGRELIHMRFADALTELRDYPGQQIHRSHWIAARAFQGLTRENGKVLAHLSDGRTLTVSRSFTAAARDMTPPAPKSAQ